MKSKPARLPFLLAAVLAAVSIGGCGTTPTGPGNTPAERFQNLWGTFDRTYPYFLHKQVDWAGARARYAPRAADAANQAELVAVVTELLAELHDVHAWLIRPDGSTLPTYTPTRPRNWDRTTWMARIGQLGWRQRAGTSWGWGRSGSVGYLTIGDWNGARVSATALDEALDSLRATSALVIDVRMNGGGNDAIAMDFAGRFATHSQPTESFRFRNGPGHGDFTPPTVRTLTPRGPWTYARPVFVLTGRGVFSSNESFVAAMRVLPQVTIVGDTTGGSSGNPAPFPLGDGWQYMVPRWIAVTVDGIVIEDNGIPPDVFVPFDPADLARGLDVTLDSAFALAGRAGG